VRIRPFSSYSLAYFDALLQSHEDSRNGVFHWSRKAMGCAGRLERLQRVEAPPSKHLDWEEEAEEEWFALRS
jgi:hypothetical protein